MKTSPRHLAFAALAALCGAAGCATAPLPPPCAASGSGPIDVSGEWETNWGPVWLTQQGNRVTGEYYKNRSGRIDGVLSGIALDFRWNEPGMSPGQGRFNFCPDNASFSGYWGSYNAWNGTRVGAPPPPAAPAMPAAAAKVRTVAPPLEKEEPWWRKTDESPEPKTGQRTRPEKTEAGQPDASWDENLRP